jgi:hypothetical protein
LSAGKGISFGRTKSRRAASAATATDAVALIKMEQNTRVRETIIDDMNNAPENTDIHHFGQYQEKNGKQVPVFGIFYMIERGF